MTAPLAERLKTETRALHMAAERSVFMGALLRGRLEPVAYGALLRNLHPIYAALEPALERHAAHPAIAPIYLPSLWRTPALEHDLRIVHGPRWADELALQPVAGAYVERLRELDGSRPDLLLAHAYVRYLGDLSGGQMLSGIVAKSIHRDAVLFYEFGDALATKDLTRAFRAGLAAVPADDLLADALVGEARLSFGLHQRLFDELAVACGTA